MIDLKTVPTSVLEAAIKIAENDDLLSKNKESLELSSSCGEKNGIGSS